MAPPSFHNSGLSVYDSADMKLWLRFILSLLLVVLLFAGARYFVQRQEQKKRDFVYQGILRSYLEVLRPGMTRREVEGYLRAKGKQFRQMCCIDFSKKHSWDDEVKIGQEDPPWFCGESNVYVGFEFSDSPQPHGEFWKAGDSDILKSVTLRHQLEICL